MFNSQHINNDPKPWRYDLLGMIPPDKRARESEQVTGGFAYVPRPEYDNNPNPILENFRRTVNRISKGLVHIQQAEDHLAITLNIVESSVFQFTEETLSHVDHARKVLTRLANIYGAEK